MARMAGTLSTAKITSMTSITIKATKGRCGGYMFSFDKKMFSINMV
jgi:hypothetical protein